MNFSRAAAVVAILGVTVLLVILLLGNTKTETKTIIEEKTVIVTKEPEVKEIVKEVVKEKIVYVKQVPKAIRPVPTRENIPAILEEEGKTVGAELGVQRGYFAKHMLTLWPSCKKYVLVDVWAQQQNYVDGANVENTEQENRLKETLAGTEPWKNAREVCRNYTTNCAPLYPENYFDFIYVDARHDYKGVQVDIKDWWPKLKDGGIMAGHDYVTTAELKGDQPNEDWSLNFDGTRDTTGTLLVGAVNEVFMSGTAESNPYFRQVVVTYREGHIYATWMVRK